MKRKLKLILRDLYLLLICYDIKCRLRFVLLIGMSFNLGFKIANRLYQSFLRFAYKELKHAGKIDLYLKRVGGLFCLVCILWTKSANAQFVTWAFHTDLPFTQIKNTAYKVAWNNRYADKLNDIKKDREKTLAYLMTVEEIQRKIYNSLSNVSGAVKDGKTIVAITKKIPLILNNLQESIKLAAGKPYLLPLVEDIYQVFYIRLLHLSTYLKDVVLSNDEKILIDPVRRHQFVYDVYCEINVLHRLSQSILNQYQLHNFQDAIDKIIPASTFYNIDKTLMQDIIRKIKLF